MLMPIARYTYERIPPLNEARNIEQHLTALYNLTELAEASKILLGAQYRSKGVLRFLYADLPVSKVLELGHQNSYSSKSEFGAWKSKWYITNSYISPKGNGNCGMSVTNYAILFSPSQLIFVTLCARASELKFVIALSLHCQADRGWELKKKSTTNTYSFESLLFVSLEINPLDYVYKSLGCRLELLNPDSDECQLVLEYIHNSRK